MLHDSHYSSNTVTNLIFFEMLEWQEFEIKKIKKLNDLCLFKITDLEDQVFTANQSDINIYSIQGKILSVLTAVIKKIAAKTDAKLNSKSKLNSESMSLSWPRSHDSQSRDLRVTRSWYHKISLAKQSQASFRFWIDDMKIFSEIFSLVYKIILHLILLLIKQHELMIFESELNVIHRTDNDYTFMKHHFSTLSSKRMRRLKFKADEFYIIVQSVRQISWHSRSANEAVWV